METGPARETGAAGAGVGVSDKTSDADAVVSYACAGSAVLVDGAAPLAAVDVRLGVRGAGTLAAVGGVTGSLCVSALNTRENPLFDARVKAPAGDPSTGLFSKPTIALNDPNSSSR